MSKRNNNNPAHYKVAGRERPGDGLQQEAGKQKFRVRQAALKLASGTRGNVTAASRPQKRAAGTSPLASGPIRTRTVKTRSTRTQPVKNQLLIRSAEAIGRTLGSAQHALRERNARAGASRRRSTKSS
jgi:hypothetical protein